MNKCNRCGLELRGKLGKGEMDSPSVYDANHCGRCNSWNVIFKNFRELHSDNIHWIAALDDIDNLLRTYKSNEHPDSTRFERMLHDREMSFSDIDKRVCNLSSDQCLPWHVTRYFSDDKTK